MSHIQFKNCSVTDQWHTVEELTPIKGPADSQENTNQPTLISIQIKILMVTFQDFIIKFNQSCSLHSLVSQSNYVLQRFFFTSAIFKMPSYFYNAFFSWQTMLISQTISFLQSGYHPAYLFLPHQTPNIKSDGH